MVIDVSHLSTRRLHHIGVATIDDAASNAQACAFFRLRPCEPCLSQRQALQRKDTRCTAKREVPMDDTEEPVRELSDLYDQQLAKRPDAVVIFSRTGTYLAISAESSSLFSVPRHFALGRSILELVSPSASAEFFFGKIVDCITQQTRVVFRVPMRSGAGSLGNYECECVPCGPDRCATFIRDLGSLLALEQTLVDSSVCPDTSLRISRLINCCSPMVMKMPRPRWRD